MDFIKAEIGHKNIHPIRRIQITEEDTLGIDSLSDGTYLFDRYSMPFVGEESNDNCILLRFYTPEKRRVSIKDMTLVSADVFYENHHDIALMHFMLANSQQHENLDEIRSILAPHVNLRDPFENGTFGVIKILDERTWEYPIFKILDRFTPDFGLSYQYRIEHYTIVRNHLKIVPRSRGWVQAANVRCFDSVRECDVISQFETTELMQIYADTIKSLFDKKTKMAKQLLLDCGYQFPGRNYHGNKSEFYDRMNHIQAKDCQELFEKYFNLKFGDLHSPRGISFKKFDLLQNVFGDENVTWADDENNTQNFVSTVQLRFMSESHRVKVNVTKFSMDADGNIYN